MKLSVIIPTLNEENYLPKLLRTLANQTFKEFEVIVVDAKSKDRTVEAAKRYADGLNQQVLLSDVASPAAQRNLGAKHSCGEYLLFLDADVLVAPEFISSALSEFDERFIDCATCLLVPLSDKLLDKFLHGVANSVCRATQYTDPYAPGACILCTRRLFNRISGFNESLHLAEDHDFVGRAKDIGRFRVLRSQRIYISVRRLRREGRLKTVSKYLYIELCRKLLGSIPNGIKYELGGDNGK